MIERICRWVAPLFHVIGVMAWGYIAIRILVWAFPPSQTNMLAVSALVIFWMFSGSVAYLIVHLSLPGGWAQRGVWRFTLFSFGFIFMDAKHQDKRIESLNAAGYAVWPLGKRWVVAPSIPGWCMRLARRFGRQDKSWKR